MYNVQRCGSQNNETQCEPTRHVVSQENGQRYGTWGRGGRAETSAPKWLFLQQVLRIQCFMRVLLCRQKEMSCWDVPLFLRDGTWYGVNTARVVGLPSHVPAQHRPNQRQRQNHKETDARHRHLPKKKKRCVTKVSIFAARTLRVAAWVCNSKTFSCNHVGFTSRASRPIWKGLAIN